MNKYDDLPTRNHMGQPNYFDHPAMSQSKMKILLESPRKFYLQFIEKSFVDEPTKSKQLGTCIDLAMTDPEEYAKLIVKDCKTTEIPGHITVAWKKSIDKWMENLNSYKLNNEFFDGLTLGEVIANCSKQLELYYDYRGIGWKCKLDFAYVGDKRGFLIDLKSTRATTYNEFIRDFFKFNYHLQAGSYSNAMKIYYKLAEYPLVLYVAVSTITGEVFALECSDELIECGLILLDRGCDLYLDNMTSQKWANDSDINVLYPPEWLMKSINNLSENKIFDNIA